MDSKETNLSLKYVSRFVENTTGNNYFENIPDDLKSFLQHYDGTMKSMVDNLSPGMYEIEIKIKSI